MAGLNLTSARKLPRTSVDDTTAFVPGDNDEEHEHK